MQTQNGTAQQTILSTRKGLDADSFEHQEQNLPDLNDCAAMVDHYAPMVKIIVARMKGRFPSHADIEELESAGMTGLLAAIERFDPSKGYSFQTYASVRIRGAILDELRAMDMVPRSVRLKQRKLEKLSAAMEQSLGRAPTDSELREEMGLDQRAFDKLRYQTRPVSIVYLDADPEGNQDGAGHDYIADSHAVNAPERIEKQELMDLVARKIMELPEQSRKVLALYFNEGMRLAEIGELMGLSEARICQIRAQALEHLRRFVSRMSQ
ncbi:MAG: FliA/WhiG family RNA polymerase sigma factor [Opitutales bacterium]|nr:FliA/WhiG family RNA polymerase sigma factor [Opitutales bacterium]